MKKAMLGLMAFVVLATTSCKKEDMEPPVPLTSEALIGHYTITKIESSIGGMRGNITDQMYSKDFMGECARDNVTSFLSTGVYEVTEGNVSCDPPADEIGTWSIGEDGSMKMDMEPVEVEFFSGKTLRVAFLMPNSTTDKFIFTYTRK